MQNKDTLKNDTETELARMVSVLQLVLEKKWGVKLEKQDILEKDHTERNGEWNYEDKLRTQK